MDEVKTRSQWLTEPSPLDDIFGTTTKSFVDALYSVPDLVFESDDSAAFARKISKGEPDIVFAPKPLKQELSRFIRIIHGWHNDDYVWHIEPASIRRPWKPREDDVLYIIAKTMHDNLPDVEAKLWLPESSWELRTITFKAFDLRNHWGFYEDRIPTINLRLFDILNAIV